MQLILFPREKPLLKSFECIFYELFPGIFPSLSFSLFCSYMCVIIEYKIYMCVLNKLYQQVMYKLYIQFPWSFILRYPYVCIFPKEQANKSQRSFVWSWIEMIFKNLEMGVEIWEGCADSSESSDVMGKYYAMFINVQLG